MAGRLGIEEIRGGRKSLDLFFAGGHEPQPVIIQGLMESGVPGLQFKAVDQFVVKVPAERAEHLGMATAVLARLSELTARQEV